MATISILDAIFLAKEGSPTTQPGCRRASKKMPGARRRASLVSYPNELRLREPGILPVVLLLPFVHDVAWQFRITLGVIGEIAQNGRERSAFMHRLGDC